MTETPPKVSVVCAWYNRSEYIRDTVDSLLDQDFDDYEIIIINDGSTDKNVRTILDSYDDIKLHIIHQDNRGFLNAIVRAIGLARAPFIAIQGAGDISCASRLFKQWRFLEDNSDAVAVGCWFRNALVGDREQIIMRRNNHTCFIFSRLLKGNVYSHGEVMFILDAYLSVGGYREPFKYAQDRDLWLRMVEKGRLCCIHEELYERRQFPNSGISTSLSKTHEKIMLSDLAVASPKLRKTNGIDIVSLHSERAMLLRPRSLRVAKFLVAAATLSSKKVRENEHYRSELFKIENKSVYRMYVVFRPLLAYVIENKNFLRRLPILGRQINRV